ncbi:MAG: hypothetical protein ACRD4Q_05165 [Candidatus Acidiferrales bacterium]
MKALGQENGAALTRPEALACLGQRGIGRGLLWHYFDPIGTLYSFRAGKAMTCHHDFILNLRRD